MGYDHQYCSSDVGCFGISVFGLTRQRWLLDSFEAGIYINQMSTSNSMFQPTPQAFMNHWRHKDVGDTPFFINFQNSLNNPRDEGFFDMLTYTCLPTFKLKSMAFTLIMLNTLYYVISLLYGDVQIGGKLLEPTQNVRIYIIQSLFSLGMLYSYFIKYQLEY